LFLKSTIATAAAVAAPRLAFGAKDKVALQMGWIKTVQYGGYFAAQEQGFFDAEGIEAEFLAGGPSIDSLNVVASGQALVGDRDSTNVILGRAKGIPVKAFAACLQISPYSLMTAKGKKISTLKEMEGKTIAITQGRRATTNAMLKRAGVDASKITFVPTGTDPGILATGQVDGYYGWYTNQGTMLAQRGFDIDYTTEHDLGNPTYPITLYATEETVEKRRDLLVRWLRAQVKGWQWYHDHPEDVARITVEKYGPKGIDLVQQTLEAKMTAPLITAGEGAKHGALWIDESFFRLGIEFGHEAGFITGDLKPADVMTQDLIKLAHAHA
jgi:ABC-type nitrate/sulfonate/bicarbonate transport system substrate-binding protein